MKKSNNYGRKIIKKVHSTYQKKTRKHLNMDSLIKFMKKDFQKILDHRAGNSKISLADNLM